MTITLYHSPFTRSLRIKWLLEEMGLAHETKLIPQAEMYQYAKSEEYLAVNPLGKYPTLVDGDLTLVESIAIMEYLMSRYGEGQTAGGLKPEPGTDLYGRYMQWLEFGEAGMGMYVILWMAHTFLLPEDRRIAGMAKWGKIETMKCLDFLSARLGDNPYVCGEQFTAADISIGYMLLLVRLLGAMDDAPENVQAYWDRLKERDAYKRAVEAGKQSG